MKNVYLDFVLKNGGVVLDAPCLETRPMTGRDITAVVQMFASFGFRLDEDALKALVKIDEKDLTLFYFCYYRLLKKLIGDEKKPIFYACFPHMETLTDEDYWANAVLHYWTSDQDDYGYLESVDGQEPSHFERIDVINSEKQTLRLFTQKDALKFIGEQINLAFSLNTTIPAHFEELMVTFYRDYPYLFSVEFIPFKENIARYFKIIASAKTEDEKWSKYLNKRVLSFVKTPTDLLRFYAVMSTGKAHLPKKIHWVSLDRASRRILMDKLDELWYSSSFFDDLARYEFHWKRVLEKLHIGEYRRQYPELVASLTAFRHGDYRTFYSQLVSLENDPKAYLELVEQKPSELIRRLDFLLRHPNFKVKKILTSVSRVGRFVASQVLLQTWRHFKHRQAGVERYCRVNDEYRVYYLEADPLPPLDQEIIAEVLLVLEKVLEDKYADYPQDILHAKIYLDPRLQNFAVPTRVRGGAAQFKTLTTGTRLQLNPQKDDFIRLYTHWLNGEERIDVDLSLEFFSADFVESTSLAWHSMAEGQSFDSYHSGDIISAPKGASEYIDLNYQLAKKYYRYVAVVNTVYTGQTFNEIPEACSGVMFLPKKGKKGKVFNPEFIEYNFALTTPNTNISIAYVLDLATMELIWMDVPYLSGHGENIVAAREQGLIATIKEALKPPMDLYAFFKLHRKRYQFVDDIAKANYVISPSEGSDLRPYEIAKIYREWF